LRLRRREGLTEKYNASQILFLISTCLVAGFTL